jgi:hypothetical protein
VRRSVAAVANTAAMTTNARVIGFGDADDDLFWFEEFFVHVLMMQFWVMFCPVVSVIHLAGSPIYPELLLTFTIS